MKWISVEHRTSMRISECVLLVSVDLVYMLVPSLCSYKVCIVTHIFHLNIYKNFSHLSVCLHISLF